MKKFNKTYIEITNVCNLNCDFCPKTKRKNEFMEPSFFKEILKQIEGYSKHIYFHVLGEPLLHPSLNEFLNISKDQGFIVNLTTNGTLIDKCKDALWESEALRQINISLHSFDANPQSKTMEDYLIKIINFSKEASENRNKLIALRLWNLEDVSIPHKEENKRILTMLENAYNLDFNIEEKLLSNNKIKIAPNIFLNMASRFNWPNITSQEYTEKGFCHGLRDQVAILVDGTVVPCCLDGEGNIPLGNIKETSFSKIIEGPRAKAMYEGFSNRKVVEELCKKCDFRSRFNI